MRESKYINNYFQYSHYLRYKVIGYDKLTQKYKIKHLNCREPFNLMNGCIGYVSRYMLEKSKKINPDDLMVESL